MLTQSRFHTDKVQQMKLALSQGRPIVAPHEQVLTNQSLSGCAVVHAVHADNKQGSPGQLAATLAVAAFTAFWNAVSDA